MIIEIAFIGCALLTLGGALGVLITKHVLYAAFFLLMSLLGAAGLFVLTGADLLAVAQLMIYVGGVLVLIIFGIMLTHRPDTYSLRDAQSANVVPSLGRFGSRFSYGLMGLIVVAVFGLLYTLLARADFELLAENTNTVSTIPTIGRQLMTEFSLPFELSGILLLMALVGATYLASPMLRKR